jgi:hypothetical protein
MCEAVGGKLEFIYKLLIMYSIIFGLVEADCWWAGYLSTTPIIRPEIVQILPPSDYSLYHVNSASKWLHLVQHQG